MMETKVQEFGKLAVGQGFYLTNPNNGTPPEYKKIASQKDARGIWSNAKTAAGLLVFVQYDKRVWTT